MKLTVIVFLLLTIGLQSPVLAGREDDKITFKYNGNIHDNKGILYLQTPDGGLISEDGTKYFLRGGPNTLINPNTGNSIYVPHIPLQDPPRDP
jgi:hypothetical protein